MSLSLVALFLVACEGDVSPGGGSVGTATPNPFLQQAGDNMGPGPTDMPGGQGDGGGTVGPKPPMTDGGEDAPVARDGGPTPGVDPQAFLDELSTAEVEALCRWQVEAQGGEGERMCPDGGTIVVSFESCTAGAQNLPHCQVFLLTDCFLSIDGDLCRFNESFECMAFLECASGGE